MDEMKARTGEPIGQTDWLIGNEQYEIFRYGGGKIEGIEKKTAIVGGKRIGELRE